MIIFYIFTLNKGQVITYTIKNCDFLIKMILINFANKNKYHIILNQIFQQLITHLYKNIIISKNIL